MKNHNETARVRHIRSAAGLSALLGILASGDVFSEEAPFSSLFSLSLDELMQVKVTSSTLTPKDLKSVPSAITVFTREQIRNMGVEFLHELSNFAPGFQSFRQGENSLQHFHSSRGHRESVTSREVLILIDGKRLNREYDNANAVPMLSLHNVAKVEFIRGPGSALYGSNAFLGVIDIKTVRGHNEAQVLTGSPERYQINLNASRERSDWQSDLSFNLFDERGDKMTVQNFETLQEETTRDPRAGQDLMLNLSHGNQTLSAMYFNREAEAFYNTERTSPDENFARLRHYGIGYRHTLLKTQTYDLDLRLEASGSSLDVRADFGTLLPSSQGFIAASQQETNIDLKLGNQWRYAEQHSLQFGADYRRSNIGAYEFSSSLNGFSELYPESEREISSLYLQNQSQLHADLALILGARYDHYSDIDSALSPRLGLVFTWNPVHTFKLLYGEAFRAPTINELALKTFSGATFGNPDLKPESIRTYELIWLANWQQHSFTLSTYYNEIESSIFVQGSSFANLPGEEEFYGLELEYGIQLTPQLLLNMNTSLMQSLPDSDFREAERLSSLALNYQAQNWNLNLSTNYAGEREMLSGSSRLTLDDYWLLNMKYRHSLRRNLSVFAAIKNLGDQEFGTPTRMSRHTMAIPNRGREFALGLDLQFNQGR